jgi:lipid-A-disaccharide synthase
MPRRLGLDGLPVTFHCAREHDLLEACDVALLASGTVTLEAMLYKRPMVVAYRMNRLTFRMLRVLVRVRHVALPNLLAGETLVPECLQDQCTPDRLGAELLRWIDDAAAVAALQARFAELHGQLRRGAATRAAAAVGALLA